MTDTFDHSSEAALMLRRARQLRSMLENGTAISDALAGLSQLLAEAVEASAARQEVRHLYQPVFELVETLLLTEKIH